MQRIGIIVPVFNDWDSLSQLRAKLEEQALRLHCSVDLIVVDDGSTLLQDSTRVLDGAPSLDEVILISLTCNVGHQRAIAIGLAYASNQDRYDCVIVMDSDGEDRPEDISELIAIHSIHPGAVIAAKRSQRSEGRGFRIFYVLYKLCFLVLTGKKIDFGNFCLIPLPHISRLTHMAELWNHLAGTIVRSRVPLIRLDTRRGTRYAGESTMNFVSLIMHGLSAVAVFSDVLFVRLLMIAMGIVAFSAIVAIVVLLVRVNTTLAIPGWATTTIGFAATLLIQGLALSATAAFMTLNNRSNVPFIPALHALQFVRDVKRSKGDV